MEEGQVRTPVIGSFRISARFGRVAYRLDLLDELIQIHNTFHVSQLRKCITNKAAVISLDDIQVDESLNYIKKPITILDRKIKVLRNKEVKLVKVQWQHRRGSKWTWEPNDEIRKHYPDLFASTDFEDEV